MAVWHREKSRADRVNFMTRHLFRFHCSNFRWRFSSSAQMFASTQRRRRLPTHKCSVGCRFMEEAWEEAVAPQFVARLVAVEWWHQAMAAMAVEVKFKNLSINFLFSTFFVFVRENIIHVDSFQSNQLHFRIKYQPIAGLDFNVRYCMCVCWGLMCVV